MIGTVLMQKGEPMDDLISRQAVIDALDDYFSTLLETDTVSPEDLCYEILMIPAADVVERKHGHWIRVPLACYGGGTVIVYECSECCENQIAQSDFCPNCGADMRGGKDEID